VNTFTATYQTELGSFFYRRIQKPREPNQRNTYATTIGKRDHQLIV